MPKDQWCYLPNEAGAYAEGMTIPADVLAAHRLSPAHRGGMGIRLPVRVRSPADIMVTRSTCLTLMLGIKPTARNMPGACGSLFPNDLGLFDMLGNVYEWCQDSWNASKPAKKGIYNDIINISESIVEKNPRLLRGGAFDDRPASVRSANRNWNAPANRCTYYGFRPSRTYH